MDRSICVGGGGEGTTGDEGGGGKGASYYNVNSLNLTDNIALFLTKLL